MSRCPASKSTSTDPMQYRTLGKSNLQVSALCLGTMMFGDQTAIDDARRIVDDAQENGVNYIGTADVYTKGASEPLRALEAMLRAVKIRYWGVSNFRGWRNTENKRVAKELGMPGPVVCQPYY